MKKEQFNRAVYSTKTDDTTADFETKSRIKLVLKLIGEGKRVLDLGCYDGYISEKIKEHGNEVVGIEISSEGARLCNERGIMCVVQDVEEKFTFPDNSFDVVFAGEVIEHVFDTDGLLQEIKRVLKPEGYFVLTTPNIASLTRRIRLLLGITPLIDIGLISPDEKEKGAGHIRYFTISSLRHLLQRNDFQIEIWKTDFILFRSLRLITLGKIFPTLGWSLIVKAKHTNR